MIILGIESATESVAASVRIVGSLGATPVAARAVEWVGATVRVDGRRRHAESLAPAIDEALRRAGTPIGSVEAIALDVGPGLFTGLRVGVATAKGLAQGLGIGVVGVTSLEILAAAAFDAGWPGTVMAVVDARRGEVFAAHYGRGRVPTELVELRAPGRHAPERVALEVAGACDLPVLACGDGALRYRALLEGTERMSVAGPSLATPDVALLISIALARLEAGASPSPALEVEPVYLREPDARINWIERPVVAVPNG